MQQNSQKIVSEELQDIITAPPSRLMKWGVILFSLMVVIIGALFFLIRYPESIKTRLTICAIGVSQPVRSRAAGQLRQLLVSNGQQVAKGQALAFVDTCILTAPAAGKISVIGLPFANTAVTTDQPLFYITSSAGAGFYGAMTIPQSEIGRVRKGQKVQIRLFSSSDEPLSGTIDSIGETPYRDSAFIARVSIDSSSSQTPGLKNGLSGESEILIRDISIADRIIENVKKSL